MPSPTNRHPLAFTALACALAVSFSGCQKRTVQAAPPVVIVPAPPETQPAPAPQPETKPGPVPETSPSTNPAPSSPPTKPAPRRPAPAPKENSEPAPAPAPPKPPAPQMSAQLSPSELASYQRLTNEDISMAEKNLQQAYGRDLDSSQKDLVEKIHSFLGQAREAIRESDWVRARNLAQKARVLSVDLVNSFQ